ncbi:MAG: cytochrome c oxidase accessory protein CcoG [Pseudomonadales bacterium]|jgi:cytochrome c oxidase accessory protein FixG
MNDKIPLQDVDQTDSAVKHAETEEFNLYEKREKIYTRKISGFYQKVRLYTGWPLLLGYFLLPWINWDGRQSVFFDLPNRQFHIVELTFWPKDFILLAATLIISAFALFFVTTWLGRVWCGYTCPQTVWTSIFMWAEQVAEGSRNQRIKMDKSPWSVNKILRKTLKHSMWLGFALLTGLTFVGYFSPIRELLPNMLTFNLGPWEAFWIFFFTFATYGNAGWLREQVCKYMCPYARFQSAMFDRDTLIVSYDPERGESRGARKKEADYKAEGLGDCIDCQMCVQVCPVGIDIRDGLQYECINCALCIDACNEVMDKMEYPRGLIRYTTENKLEHKTEHKLRPKLIGYGAVLVIMIGVFAATILNRATLELDIIRDRSTLYNTTLDGLIENSYTLKVLNKSQENQTYLISVSGIDGLELKGDTRLDVASGELIEVTLRAQIDPVHMPQTNMPIEFKVNTLDESAEVSEESRFIGPAVR